MKHKRVLVALWAAGLATALGGCSGAGPEAASSGNSTSAASSDRMSAYAQLASLPDWSGAWEPLRFAAPDAAGGPKPPRLTPAYAPVFAAYQEKNRTTPGINFVSAVANCVPPGLPVIMQQPFPIEFLFTPGRVSIITESYSMVRRVYTDGSKLPAEPDPTYLGTSVGHWEGATLVIETIAILPETSPLAGITGHSDKMRVTERVRLIEPDVLATTAWTSMAIPASVSSANQESSAGLASRAEPRLQRTVYTPLSAGPLTNYADCSSKLLRSTHCPERG
jgi:hypothetical protein